jgi:phenylalanyl-tRNA synthetase beta chain
MLLFENAKVYLPTTAETSSANELPEEPARLTLGFISADDKVGFYRMKGYVEAILAIAGISNAVFKSCKTEPTFHPGRCAEIYAGDVCLGVFGEAHPETADNYGIGCKVYVAELAVDAIYDARRAEIRYTAIPKHPAIERDFSFVCDESMEVGAIEGVMAKAGGALVENVALFDIYRGPQVGEGKKSVSLRVTLRAADRTLTVEEADKVTKKILNDLKFKMGLELRN